MNPANDPNAYYRDPLKPGTAITLTRLNTNSEQRTFVIRKVLGQGACMLSYQVDYEAGDADCRTDDEAEGMKYIYVLKELYPVSPDPYCSILRLDPHLQIDQYEQNTACKGFYRHCRERYMKAYRLQLAMANGMPDGNAGDAVLNQTTSLPIDLFEDRQSGKNDSYALYALFQYNIGENYETVTDSDLESLVRTYLKVADVARKYHQNGFLWLDIKEENIHVVAKDTVHESVMLFDFDSLVAMDDLATYQYHPDIPPKFVLSFSPTSHKLLLPAELERIYQVLYHRPSPDYKILSRSINVLGKFGARTDIFMLGSMFFKRLFGRAPTETDCIAIQQNAPLPPSDYLRGRPQEVIDQVTLILQNTLHYTNREKRYAAMDDYLSDLKKLMELLENDTPNRRRKLNEIATQNIRCLLYHTPLYTTVAESDSVIHAALIGFGECAQIFLDTALQAAQIPKKQLLITIYYQNGSDVQAYLDRRPELCSFFNTAFTPRENNTIDSECYGKILFIKEPVDGLCKQPELLPADVDYAFIDTGDERINCETAAAISQRDEAASKRIVCYAVRQPVTTQSTPDSAIAVCVTKDLSDDPVYAELERMAFNAHLVWEKNLNLDFIKVKNDFLDPYNYHSSLLYAVSLPYKLYAMGISLSQCGADKAAALCAEKLRDQAMRNSMIYYEHRRWVTEKICDGYTCMADYEECADGKTKDATARKHICICKSYLHSTEQNAPLNKWSHAQWDFPQQAAFTALDPLDKMSVMLHRMYLRHAKAAVFENLLCGAQIRSIREQIGNDLSVRPAFDEWFACAKDLYHRTSAIDIQARRYKGLQNALYDAVRHTPTMTPRNKNTLKLSLDAFMTAFYPVYASCLYTDYKAKDVDLCEQIPFVLTYAENFCMVIPYHAGETATERFSNIAAATIVNPSLIIYPYYCADESDFEALKRSLPHLCSYIRTIRLKSEIRLLIGYAKNLPLPPPTETEALLKQIGNGADTERSVITAVNCVPSAAADAQDGMRAFAAFVAETLSGLRKEIPRCVFEMRNAPLCTALSREPAFADIPQYQFEPSAMRFTDLRHSALLGYIGSHCHAAISDILRLTLSDTPAIRVPSFCREYRDLWKLYLQSPQTWNEMIRKLRACTVQNDNTPIAVFNADNLLPHIRQVQWLFPVHSEPMLRKFLRALKTARLAEPESCIFIQEEHCVLQLHTRCSFSRQLLLLRGHIDLPLRFETAPSTVTIWGDRLTIRCPEHEQWSDDVLALPELLCSKGYFTDFQLTPDDTLSSFTFSSHMLKQFLTTESQLFDICLYHQLKFTGHCDDLICELQLPPHAPHADAPHFACVFSKGFSTVFVGYTTAADAPVCADTYAKYAARYGIHAKTVVVTDRLDGTFCVLTESEECRFFSGPNVLADLSDFLLSLTDPPHSETL